MTDSLCHDVLALTQNDVARIAASFANLHKHDVETMEEAAALVVDHLYQVLRPAPDAPAQCSLIRLFKTCGVEDLPPALYQRAIAADPEFDSGADAEDGFRTLTLLASRGAVPEWNSRHTSRAHQVIPLKSTEAVEKIPMIANLIRMLGLNLSDVVAPNPDLTIAGFYPLSVFYVDEAVDSPFIPAKDDFVVPHDIHSVVGFGGLLTFSDMFTVIMFFNVAVPRDVAALFKDLAQEVHQLLLPFQNNGQIFKENALPA